jgi:hypothetical protein
MIHQQVDRWGRRGVPEMSTEFFDEVVRRAAELTAEEKLRLAVLLAEQGRGKEATNGDLSAINRVDGDPEKRKERLAWLKAHREEYSGQYVALDGERLMGHARTMRGAVEDARKNGSNNPFVAYVLSSEVIADGGL